MFQFVFEKKSVYFKNFISTPYKGGLSLPEIMYIGNRIHDTGKLKTLDLVEVNPLLKTSENDIEKTVFSASRTILSFFGYKTLGTKNPGHEVPRPDRLSESDQN